MTYAYAGKTALVTGAASGIGEALTKALSNRGCHLALVDIDADGLERVAGALRSNQLRVTTHRIDLGDKAAIAALPDEVGASHNGVDLLFNNAGVALGGAFADVAEDDFDWLLDINLFGVIRMTRAFLPALRASADGRLINVSSVYGLIAPPGQAPYSASKFAVRGFTEALRHELAEDGVLTHTVHPGGIKTNIARNARVNLADMAEVEEGIRAVEASFITSPEKAAEVILTGVDKRRPRILIGPDAKFIAVLERLFPTRATGLILKLMSKRAS